MTRRPSARVRLASLVVAAGVVVAGCGGAGEDEDTPDEASFCLLAVLNQPVAEASAAVLHRLDELAPGEIDEAVVTLRKGAEEMEEHPAGSPEVIAVEFEVRFRPDHIAARRRVEAFVADTCPHDEPRSPAGGSGVTGSTDSGPTDLSRNSDN